MSEVIDDKWAAVWPRRWVMVRDAAAEEWSGPVQLAFVDSDGDCFGFDSRWYLKGNCRPATPEEIATVEPATASTKQPDPGPGWRIASGDDWKDERCELWCEFSKEWYLRPRPSQPFQKHICYRIPIDSPQPNEQIAVKEPKPSDEMARHLELKLLAEMAWAALLSSPTDGKAKWFAEFSWNAAEAMYAESERRRPK